MINSPQNSFPLSVNVPPSTQKLCVIINVFSVTTTVTVIVVEVGSN